MSTYRPPDPKALSFGDICEASFLVSIADDSLTCPVFPTKLATDAGQTTTVFLRQNRRGTRFVVAGRPTERAVVLSDSCAIETALGRGPRQAHGKIWFAPLEREKPPKEGKMVTPPPEGEEEEERAGRMLNPYKRQTLQPDPAHDPDIWRVLVADAFPVDAKTVLDALVHHRTTFLLFSLVDDVAVELRARWSAFSVRAGPFVALDNAENLLTRLQQAGVEEESAKAACAAINKTSDAGWRLDAQSFENAGTLSSGNDLGEDIRALVDDLEVVRAKADHAHQLFSELLDQLDATSVIAETDDSATQV